MDSDEFAEQWGAMAQEALSGMSGWRRAHPQATLSEIERETDRRLAVLRARLLTEAAHSTAAVAGGAPDEALPCPQCGGGTVRNGKRKRRLTTQHEQALELERQQLQCGQCGHTFFPPG